MLGNPMNIPPISIAAAKAIASGGFKANPTLRDEGGAANDLGSLRERMARLLSKP